MVLKNIGITGGSGVLGTHLLKFLIRKKIKIKSTYRKKIPYQHKYITWIKTDLNNLSKKKIFHEYFKQIDVLILNAATTKIINDIEIYKKDIRSTERLSKWCLENQIPLVYISGSIVYKSNNNKYVNENYSYTKSPIAKYYGLSKIKCEKIIKKKIKKGLKAIILRPTSIYGLNQNDKKIINKIKYRLMKKTPIEIFKNQIKINLIHASDVVKALFKLLINNKFGIYNLSYKKDYNFKEIIITIAKTYNLKPILIHTNKNIYEKNIQYKLNTNKIYKSINWLPKINLEKGLKLIKNNKYYL